MRRFTVCLLILCLLTAGSLATAPLTLLPGSSGNAVKEGVIEAMKFFTNVKTYSLPWPG